MQTAILISIILVVIIATAAILVANARKPHRETIYIAGPMRGHQYFNYPAFDEAAAQLQALGYRVLNPAQIDRQLGFDEKTQDFAAYSRAIGARDPQHAMEITAQRNLKHVIEADTLCLLPGWETSKGAVYERAAAHYLGRQVRTLEGLLMDPQAAKKPTAEPAENAEGKKPC